MDSLRGILEIVFSLNLLCKLIRLRPELTHLHSHRLSPPVRIHSGSSTNITSGVSKQVYYPARSPQQQPSPEPLRSPQSSGFVSSSSPKVRFGLYQTTSSPEMRANPVIQRSFKKPASAVTVVKKKQDIAEDQFKRKQIPDWARGEQLKDAIRRQYEAEINYVEQ